MASGRGIDSINDADHCMLSQISAAQFNTVVAL